MLQQHILDMINFSKRRFVLQVYSEECVDSQQIDFTGSTASMELSSSSIRHGSRIKKPDLRGKGIRKEGEKGVEQEVHVGAQGVAGHGQRADLKSK